MPANFASRPGGGETASAARFWSPSGRVSSIENGVKAPAWLLSEDALNPGLKGRTAGGQGAPPGPEVSVKSWVADWVGEQFVPRGEDAGDRIGAALGRASPGCRVRSRRSAG